MPHNVSPLVTVCSRVGFAAALPKAVRFTARQDGGIMLRGVVDAYEISLSHQGLLMSLEGRGMAALGRVVGADRRHAVTGDRRGEIQLPAQQRGQLVGSAAAGFQLYPTPISPA